MTADLQARRRLGLTATLVREDGREGDVFSLIGPKRYDAPWKDIEAQGWIAPADCVEVRVTLPEAERLAYAIAEPEERYRLAVLHARQDRRRRRALVDQHRGEPTLVIGQYLDQLDELADELGAPVIKGETPVKERQRLFEAFRSGEITLLVVSKVANFSIDLPEARSPSRCPARSARARRRPSGSAGCCAPRPTGGPRTSTPSSPATPSTPTSPRTGSGSSPSRATPTGSSTPTTSTPLADRWPLRALLDVRDELLAAWDRPGYHDLRHLAEVLDRLDDLDRAGAASTACRSCWRRGSTTPSTTGSPRPRSAPPCSRSRTLPDPPAAEVARLVRMTEHHQAFPDDLNAAALSDADLAILAAGPERYDGVRARRTHRVCARADADFRAGRAAVLRDLLAGPTLFRTPQGQSLWEERARANVQAEIERLG